MTSGDLATLATSGTSANRVSTTGGDITILHRSGDLRTVGGDINVGNNRVLILVDNGTGGGNFDINDRILLGPGGFFAVIARGNITVAGSVGEPTDDTDIDNPAYPHHIGGIYYAGGQFQTGSSIRQLKISGSVIGMTGVNLGTRTHIGQNPSVFVEFRPDLTFSLSQIGLRRKVFQELVGP